MINYCPNLTEDISPLEILYRSINNIDEVPKCPICGNIVDFDRFDRGYKEFCSISCRRSKQGENIVRMKTEDTFIAKYGCRCATQNEEVKQKIIDTN